MGQGIFVSYRRSDTRSATGWLCRELRSNGFDTADDLFIDIDNIPPGADFRAVIRDTLEQCDLVIVVLGRSWLTATDDRGARRLDSPSDTHRLEVAAALRSDAIVVPVRVEGASHPSAEDLPDDLSELAYRNSWELTDRRFAEDVAELAKHLRQLRARVQASRRAAQSAAEQRDREAQQRVADEAKSRDAAMRARMSHAELVQRETDARLRKEEAEARLYEEQLKHLEPTSTASKKTDTWTNVFLYWIPGFCAVMLIGCIAIIFDLVRGEEADLSWGEIGIALPIVVVAGVGSFWYGITRDD